MSEAKPLRVDDPIQQAIREIEKRATEAFKTEKQERPSSFDKTLTDYFKRFRLAQIKAEQEIRDQIVKFRRRLFTFLLAFMTAETVVLYLIVIVASLTPKPRLLDLNDTTLQILVGATIAQISAMLIVIVRSVYSDSLNKTVMARSPVPE